MHGKNTTIMKRQTTLLTLLACILLLAELCIPCSFVGHTISPKWLHILLTIVFSIVSAWLFAASVRRKLNVVMVLTIVGFVQVAPDFTDILVAIVMWCAKTVASLLPFVRPT
jgi:ABC-type amino acid transport system permease subunit